MGDRDGVATGDREGEGGEVREAALEGRSSLRRSRLLAALIAGTYSWALTVLPALSVHGAISFAGLFALFSIVSLLASPLLPPGRWALLFALDLFVGFSILSWLSGSHQLIDPPFAIFGTFGWLAYTLAVGALSTPEQSEDSPDPGPQLDPRTRPSRLSAFILVLVVVLVLGVLGAAWEIRRPAVAVLGHVLALAVVLLALRAGAGLSTYVQVVGTKLARPLSFRSAVLPFLTLLLLAGLTFVWRLSQH